MDMPDIRFARLNDAERRILRLLAEGHTIKSAAGIIGASPAALNERLREARRKTGVGSSRELARKLRALENRDREIGVAADRDHAPPAFPQSAPMWRKRTGVLLMLMTGLAIAAGASLIVSQMAPGAGEAHPVDPIIGAPLPDSRSAAEWQARLRIERRDAEWATDAERVLRARYARISKLDGERSPIRITCAATICEVAGVVAVQAAEPRANSSREDVVNRTMAVLQGKQLSDELLGHGLKWETALFASTDAEPTRPAFFIYYTRVDA